jgi:N-methylhydantoinase B
MGARSSKDGKDGVQVHITNTSNLPVESIEQEYPLRVEEYSLIEDSGGAGKYRGGMGLRRIVTPVDHDCVFNGAGERFSYQPWGLFGGEAGGSGQFLIRDTEGERRLVDKPDKVQVAVDTRIVIETPGAGGYGPPAERSAEAVARDLESGKFSPAYIERHFKMEKSEK